MHTLFSKLLGRRFRSPDNDDAGGSGDGDQGGGNLMGRGGSQGNDADAGDQGGDAGADGAGADGAGDQGGSSGEWSWSETVKGEGDRPDWLKSDKFKTVEAQAQALTELETKIGPAAELIGLPESGDYVNPATPDGIDGDFDNEDPLLVGFKGVAKEMGLSQKAFDQVVVAMAGVIATENAADEAKLSDAIASLGQNADARIEAVDTFVKATVGEPGWQLLSDAIGNDVAAYAAFEKIVAKASGDAQLAGGSGQAGAAFTKTDIEAEQYKVFPEGHPMVGQSMYENDKAHRAKVDGMWKKLFPGEDIQQVG